MLPGVTPAGSVFPVVLCLSVAAAPVGVGHRKIFQSKFSADATSAQDPRILQFALKYVF
jgi:hypothetical protein